MNMEGEVYNAKPVYHVETLHRIISSLLLCVGMHPVNWQDASPYKVRGLMIRRGVLKILHWCWLLLTLRIPCLAISSSLSIVSIRQSVYCLNSISCRI